MKTTFISFCLLVLLIASLPEAHCAQRFKDDQMLKTHHNHANLETQAAPSITVHLIPHSHDDVGWLKTVDDYYYGGDMSTQLAGVQYTIDAVVEQLSKNSTYKFSIVEVAFLYRWWNQANETQRQRMKTLYNNGQIEFLNGGWCMSDEAAPYYEDVIDQMTIGHRWLKETFGAIPTAAWHIDPFGHQSSSASMFSQMGMQAFFFARIDYQDKSKRLNQKSMQMIWRPMQYNSDKSTYVFTHVNYYHYSPPPGFCFDIRCTDEPVKDNPDLGDYNLPTKALELVTYFKSMSLHFRSPNLMHTLGEDFHYIDGNIWFKNVDKLINYINARSAEYGMTIKYSTPSEYISTIQKEGNTYPTKVDDFFPYADYEHAYWTGYFTSRTGLKGFIRELGKDIQSLRKHVSELLIANASTYALNNKDKVESMIWQLQMAQGILQHHDAVAGTSKQKVAYDYVNTALKAIAKGKPTLAAINAEQMKRQIGQQIDPSTISYNLFWNETSLATGIAEWFYRNKTILIQLYNPSAKGTYQVKLRVPKSNFNIVTAANQAVKGDVFCPNTIGNLVNQCELVFNLDFEESSNNYVKIQNVPKASASAQLVDMNEFRIVQKTKTWAISNTANLTMDRTSFQFTLQMKTGSESFAVGYKYYESYQGSGQKGGAYIFRPASDTPKQHSSFKKIYSIEGTQTLVIVLEGTTTLTKLYFTRRQDYVENYGFEIETWLDSISIDDNIGKEVCLSLKTNFDNQNKFYTDSNGLEEQLRVLNFRPTWNLTINEAVAGNYYPVNSHIRISDPKASTKHVSVLTDRSMGAGVINKGEIELMVHRRLLADDWRGVDENLNETEVINGKEVGLTQSIRHYVVFGNNFRKVQKQNDQKILITIAPSASGSFSSGQLLPAALKVPDSVKLYLRPMFNTNSYLFRLHNMDPENPAIVSIPDGWKVTELTLSANQEWNTWGQKQFKWNEQVTIVEESTTMMSVLDWFKQTFTTVCEWMVHLIWNDAPTSEQATLSSTQINLRPFDMRTMKLQRI